MTFLSHRRRLFSSLLPEYRSNYETRTKKKKKIQIETINFITSIFLDKLLITLKLFSNFISNLFSYHFRVGSYIEAYYRWYNYIWARATTHSFKQLCKYTLIDHSYQIIFVTVWIFGRFSIHSLPKTLCMLYRHTK